MIALTNAQRRILYNINRFIIDNGKAPTFRELASLCGYSSLATLYGHLQRLKKKGYIDWEERKKRSFKVTKDIA